MNSPPLLQYHGSKWKMAPWIISHFPNHRTYVEPFGGSGAVLFQKPPSVREVYNDRDDVIVNLFQIIRTRKQELIEAVTYTPYARTEFERSFDLTDDPLESARRTLVRAGFGFGSGGATKNTTGFRVDTDRRGKTVGDLFQRSSLAIAAYAERMRNVLIENKDAIEVIADHDRADTLIYADPPYLPETRKKRGDVYRHEMSAQDHEKLLDALLNVKGMVVLSGYDNDLYNSMLRDWESTERTSVASGGRGGVIRREKLWFSKNIKRKVLI